MAVDKNIYGNDWDIRRFRIFERDNWKCRHCGTPDSRTIPITKNTSLGGSVTCNEIVFLQCAHLDNNKLNMQDSNLISLCQKCHLRYDLPWKIYKRLSNK